MNGRNRFPFTPSQWQELEHQALIYKYMASGISIPPDLLFTIKRNHFDSSRLLPHHPQHFGWNYLPMGLGRKIDPEPGRCRRTDGKKWRCSKEAYPDSKYCERHMHRGKNRSRKPVEVLKTTPTTVVTTNTDASAPTILSITKNTPALSPTTHDTYHHHHHHPQHSFLYHQSRPSNAVALSFQDNSAPLFLDTHNNNTDCRNGYVYGLKEEVDEHAFFTEPSGTMRSFSTSSMEDSWQLTPLTISSSSSSKERNENNEYSYLQLQSLGSNKGCYGDIKCETLRKQLGKEEPQKTIHRFFDEWPPKSRGSWLDLDDKSSTTQLSISIPTSSHDFTTFSSTSQRGSSVGGELWLILAFNSGVLVLEPKANNVVGFTLCFVRPPFNCSPFFPSVVQVHLCFHPGIQCVLFAFIFCFSGLS
ncbi:Growth-regulating factor 3, partial [Mucuna pruriens]